jgi:hypothetical protein
MMPRLLDQGRRRFLLLAAVLVAVAWGGVSVIGLALAREALLPVHQATADTIARAVAAQVERAVDYGIPLGALEGMNKYLADVMGEHGDLRYLQIADAEGRPLYAAAPAGVDIPPEGGVRRLLQSGGRTIGLVRVGYADAAVQTDGYAVISALLMALIVAALPVLEALRCWTGRVVTEPGRQVSALLVLGAQGDFRRRPHTGGSGEIGAAAVAIGRLARHLTRRRLELEGRAEDARADAYEEGASARIDAILGKALGTVQIAGAGARPEAPRLERPVRRLMVAGFVFAFALQPWTISAVLAALAAAALLPRLFDGLWPLIGIRLVYGLSAIAMLAGLVLPAVVPLPLVWAAVLMGGGAGIAIHAATEGHGLPTGHIGALWELDALGGAASGLVLAALLRVVTGDERDFPLLMPGIVLVLTLVAGGLLGATGVERERSGWLRPVELSALLGRWNGAGLLLAAALPAGALFGFGLMQARGSVEHLAFWSAGLMAGCLLAVPLTVVSAGGVRLAVRWMVALVLFAVSLSVMPEDAALVLLGMGAALALAAVAGQAQRVAAAEREVLGEKRVLIGARLARFIGLFLPFVAAEAGFGPPETAAILVLWLGGGAVFARLTARGAEDGREEQA